MSSTVLICDDNRAVHRSLEDYLKDRGIRILSAFCGKEALEIIRTCRVSLLVLDIMLPDTSGLDVLRELKKQNAELPVLLLSAKDSETDRVVGLELGADDYVVKPFFPREVALRIGNLLARQSGQQQRRVVVFSNLRIDLDSYETSVDEARIPLSPRETELLAYLASKPGKVVSREVLLNVVWKTDFLGDPRVVDTQIKRIRHKLSNVPTGFVIRSVYGVGYKLEALQDA